MEAGMRKVRVRGLVREATRVRRALTRNLSPAERSDLQKHLGSFLQRTHAALKEHRVKLHHLPLPSRRALEYLQQVECCNEKDAQPVEGIHPPRQSRRDPQSVSFPGLRAYLDNLLDDFSDAVILDRCDIHSAASVIEQTAARLDRMISDDRIQPIELTQTAYGLLGWFRFFRTAVSFERYATAVRQCHQAIAALPKDRAGWKHPVRIHFRPCSHLYRWRSANNGTRITMPTLMIGFQAKTFEQLARTMLGHKRPWPAIHRAMIGERCQQIIHALRAAGGPRDLARGQFYNLDEIFASVNKEMFDGAMVQPQLVWTEGLSTTVFGHYEFVEDRLSISRSLDDSTVPLYVLEHVMHHELLHKQLGVSWRGSRQHTHTREFRAAEKLFPQYREAESYLKKFSDRSRRG
jgi:hypothetical protein